MSKELVHIADIQNLNVDINTDDVLNIAVSKAEDHMHIKIAEMKRQQSKMDKEIQRVTDEIQTLYQTQVDLQTAKPVKALLDVLKAFGKDLKATVSYEVAQVDASNFKAVVSLSDGNRYGTNMTLSYECTIDEKILKIKTELVESWTKERDAVMEEHAEWRRKLASIDRLERRWRGQLAEKSLSGTEGGKELLSLLTDNIEDQVKQLTV